MSFTYSAKIEPDGIKYRKVMDEPYEETPRAALSLK